MPIISPLPYTLTNGTTADATQVEANFDQIVANTNANAAARGANSDITSLTGLTTPLGRTYGGSQLYVGGTTTGAANAQVLASPTPTGFTLFTGAMVAFVAGFTNAGATTLNVNSTGAKNVFRQLASGAAACIGGEIVAGQLVVVVYDGTQFQLINSSLLTTATLSSLAALSITTGNLIYGSGTNAVSVLAPGTANRVLQANGAAAPTWVNTVTLSSATVDTVNAVSALQFNGVSIPRKQRKTSTALTPTASSVQTYAHGLGSRPSPQDLFAYIVCTSSELGYATNEAVQLTTNPDAGTGDRGGTLSATSTNINFTIGSNGIYLVDQSIKVVAPITPANWSLYLGTDY